jgi:hypothetical protein
VVVKGIGSAILLQQLETNIVYNISRNAPEITHPTSNIFGRCFEEALPEIEDRHFDLLPGSINLKPIESKH